MVFESCGTYNKTTAFGCLLLANEWSWHSSPLCLKYSTNIILSQHNPQSDYAVKITVNDDITGLLRDYNHWRLQHSWKQNK